MTHECMFDNEWEVEIKCRKCNKILGPKEAEILWNALKVTKW